MQRRVFLGFIATATVGISNTFANSNFQQDNSIWLRDDQKNIFLNVCYKLEKIKKYVGYANFNLISFDDALKVAKRVSKIGAFSKEELDFIEEIFYQDPSFHGFYGKRICNSLTNKISRKDVSKIPHSGHYLFKGHSKESYERVIKDVGNSLILTSGVRNIVKQMNLYFNKIKQCNGNISLASHSLAPPAYSYHTVGDFDVGKKGWGYKNFTVSFVRTKEFWRLKKLPYISMRYTINNKDGVRFEPWHVKII